MSKKQSNPKLKSFIGVTMDRSLRESIQKIAKREMVSFSDIVRRALRQFVGRGTSDDR